MYKNYFKHLLVNSILNIPSLLIVYYVAGHFFEIPEKTNMFISVLYYIISVMIDYKIDILKDEIEELNKLLNDKN